MNAEEVSGDEAVPPGANDESLGRGRQSLIGLAVTAIGAMVLVGSSDLPAEAGYGGVGPGAVPRVVGALLTVVGVLLTVGAWRKGFAGVDEAEERRLGFDVAGFAWVSAGLLQYGLLIESLGFVLSSAILFVCVARGFGSHRIVRDLICALLLALSVYLVFSWGLGIALPQGILPLGVS